jgi:hypothetical protein
LDTSLNVITALNAKKHIRKKYSIAQYEDNLNGKGDNMSRSLRKINREREKIPSPFQKEVMAAWNRGFSAGAREQRKSDIEHLVKILEGLEEIPGIGEKTAWKVREFFLQRFGSVDETKE